MAIKYRISKVRDKDNLALGYNYKVNASTKVGKTNRTQKAVFLMENKTKALKLCKKLKSK